VIIQPSTTGEASPGEKRCDVGLERQITIEVNVSLEKQHILKIRHMASCRRLPCGYLSLLICCKGMLIKYI
jgi:hypothetical protein